ncbi:hypothetical protein AMELA_G00212850 [Ameiurus melas]|uniref:Uncharacterized protein n=1 Tax=Ameiurus melas TaxID=219545 RepID=A0A7J6A0B5_AMEME|nr:hypothetical protein AMELA_G00212850 [Ameiurus melas]
MTFINIPVEWFSIGFDWTWMLLFGDIRQGNLLRHAALLLDHLLWRTSHGAGELHGYVTGVVFCVDLLDQTERNRFSMYWKQVGPIVFGSFCLFIDLFV